MGPVDLVSAVAGGLLLFVVPGLTVARALFPEWRFRGPDGLRRSLETATLAFVLSVGLTVVVGTALLGLAPGGFAASWGDPLLEAALAAIALVAFVAGVVRGAYSERVPVPPPPVEPGSERAWELGRTLDATRARAAALRRDGAGAGSDADRQLQELAARSDAVARAREEEYAR